MTQEILDYLLIRSVLINNNSEEIIKAIDSKEIFEYLVDNIYKLMQEEDFVLVFNELPQKVIDVINSYRFSYNKDKELNQKINNIIGIIGKYKSMAYEEKNYLINCWLKEESKNRQLPFVFQTPECLQILISLDCEYFKNMIYADKPIQVDNIIEYLSIVNIIINKFPDILEDGNFYETFIENCNIISSTPKLPYLHLKMTKKTLKQLKKLSASQDKQLIIKKKKTNN